MTLESGAQLGPYRIQDSVGAGGMGEVYRALDPRLGRQVAVKILPADVRTDPDRLQRFEQEARAIGALNHPNILAIHDFGTHEGSPYVVFELLEGETLRQRIGGSALPVRKSVDYAAQIALGLAAAHERGIVHRDLKPENLFVTKDGRVKILDFGLAKLTGRDGETHEAAATRTLGPSTEPGKLMGTVGYMSPEQVRARPADHRSDIFTFGAILYEMLSGRRAFHGDSAIETMNSILKEDPQDLTATNRSLPPELERIVRHCLEKNPDERFQSARDLAFDLQALSGTSGPLTAPLAALPARRARWMKPFLAALLLTISGVAGYFAGRGGLSGTTGGGAGRMGAAGRDQPTYRRLTFRNGTIRNARFTPDGRSIVYTAEWGVDPISAYTTSAGSAESRALGFASSDLFGVSSRGELALSLNSTRVIAFISQGTLARVPITGEAPRPVVENVGWADWAPDGDGLAVVRMVGGQWRLEMPLETVLYETAGWLSHARISPDGARIAFLHHALRGDDGGSVMVVEKGSPARTISDGWLSIQGLAWSPDGKEVWFTATKSGIARALWAVDLEGRERLLASAPGTLTLQDVARDGAVLVTRDNARMALAGSAEGQGRERDLSWFDWSLARAISADGTMVLFDETGEGGGDTYSVYARKLDGSPAVRLSDGAGLDLSPDARWAIVNKRAGKTELTLVPTGTGAPRELPISGLDVHDARFFPDGKRLLLVAYEKEGSVRPYVLTIDGGAVRPLAATVMDSRGFAISLDGASVLIEDPEHRHFICPSDGGPVRPLPEFDQDLVVLSWTSDPRCVYARKRRLINISLFRVDLLSGRSQPDREIVPGGRTGLARAANAVITPDGKSYAYSYVLNTSDLYRLEGVR